MTDAQNERTNRRSRRRRRRKQRGNEDAPAVAEPQAQQPQAPPPTAPLPDLNTAETAPVVRPADIAPPEQRIEEYCIHHMASFTECHPMQIRSGMTTLRHLRVDQFGEATLYCDCLHNGPHEWPPSMQKLETAVELNQFLADSTNNT